jgi:tetratricopeptide (TPR) repeat protein
VALLQLATAAPEHPATLFLLGKLRFHEGNYDDAVDALRGAAAAAPNTRAIASLLALAESTQQVVDDYDVFTTQDGLFEIRYDASRDAVLIPWAAETLEAAYYEIGYDLGYWPGSGVVADGRGH